MLAFTKCPSEKYLKKLVGKTEMEDALKKLDKLTQEEARMAIAENLKITHAVDDRVKAVVDKVVEVDTRATRIDDAVIVINDKVAVAIDGMWSMFRQSS
jgi:selenophosphate synthetase-related protein